MYHLVFPAKYRRAAFDDRVDEKLKNICLEIELRYELKFLEIGTDREVQMWTQYHGKSKSYMWVMTNTGERTACVFNYADNRSQRVPLELLSHGNTALVLDGYDGYQKACDEYGIKRLGCWAHARRKFKEAQDVQPKGKTVKADQGLAFI